MKPFELEISGPGRGRRFNEWTARMKPGNAKTGPGCGASSRYEGDDASKLKREVK